MTLLAAFAALLGGTSGQDSVLLGSPIAGRTQPELEEVIGFFVNMLVLRIDLGGDPTFRELVGRVREHALGAYAHQELPFERLVEALAPERDPARNPLVQVVLQLQSGGPEPPLRIETGAAPVRSELQPVARRRRLPWRAGVRRRPVRAHDRRADRGAVRRPRRGGRRRSRLQRAVAAAHHAGRARAARRLERHRATRRPRLRPHAGRRPCRPLPTDLAVAAGAERLTYGELDRRAERLARRLRALGAGRDVPIAVAVERSPDLAIAALAVLKAGAAYVPLDPGAPEARNTLILDELRAPVVLTTERGAAGLAGRGPLLFVDDDAEPPAGAPPLEPAGPGDIAYVIHTSGSTGRPKGVQVEHRSLANLTAWHVDRYGLDGARPHDAARRAVVRRLGLGAVAGALRRRQRARRRRPVGADRRRAADLARRAAHHGRRFCRRRSPRPCSTARGRRRWRCARCSPAATSCAASRRMRCRSRSSTTTGRRRRPWWRPPRASRSRQTVHRRRSAARSPTRAPTSSTATARSCRSARPASFCSRAPAWRAATWATRR